MTSADHEGQMCFYTTLHLDTQLHQACHLDFIIIRLYIKWLPYKPPGVMGISESESDIKKKPVLFIAGGAEVLAIAHRTQEEWPTFKLKKAQ